ncbi:hypothetical protein FKP32DRAFT_1596573 [Trametes sanguinea]|nr:hypothetical protein FKP32DRAFT_1596573 [Trametes sanguinea]
MPAIFSRLTGLPDELQVRILSELDPPSILACREASPELKETIDNSIEVNYQLELALSGMIDGPRPSNSACTRDRLAALRAYRAAYDAGKHPTRGVLIDVSKQEVHARSARHLVYHASNPNRRGPRRLTVYRPPASFCGIEEQKLHFEGVQELGDDYPVQGTCYVDVQEDLLAYMWRLSSDYPFEYRCRLQLLSGRHCEPHPAATQSIVDLNPLTIGESRYDGWPSISGFDDLIVFRFNHRDSFSYWESRDTVIVLNWKTGVTVWYMDLKRSQIVTLLSCRLLAVIDYHTRHPAIHLFSFDPCAPSGAAPSILHHCTCSLALPIRGVDPRFKLELTPPRRDDDIARRPSYHSAAPGHNTSNAPLFQRDPSLTPLVVRFMGGISVLKREYWLIVPPDTLSKWYQEKSKQRKIPWEQWGPQGTRMICLPEPEYPWPGQDTVWVDVYGSCVGVFERKSTKHVVKIYEVHPYASLRPPPPPPPPPGDAAKAKAPRKPLWIPAENKVRGPKVVLKRPPVNFEDPLWTSYPVRKTIRVVPHHLYALYGGSLPRQMAMGHDDLVVFQYKPGGSHHYDQDDRLLYTTIVAASTV